MVAFVVGLAVVVATVGDVLFTMVLPRRVLGVGRVSIVMNRLVLVTFSWVARAAHSYDTKDHILAPVAPIALGGQLISWAIGLVVGFALILVALGHSVGNAFIQSIAATFTVGAQRAGGVASVPVDVSAGAIWVVVVALQIAYLPALYQAFSRRESLVTLLESMSGLPAWGPEILVRHEFVGITDTLPDLYASWEAWAAEVAESHATYPVLLMFRSPEPWYSWVVGLLAVLDAAALHTAVAPTSATSRARLCLRMGFTLFQRVAAMLGWEAEASPDPSAPIELTFEEYSAAVDMVQASGFPLERSAEESWKDFTGWRVNYEAAAYRLADYLSAPPAPWSGSRRKQHLGTVLPHRPPQRRPETDPPTPKPPPALTQG